MMTKQQQQQRKMGILDGGLSFTHTLPHRLGTGPDPAGNVAPENPVQVARDQKTTSPFVMQMQKIDPNGEKTS